MKEASSIDVVAVVVVNVTESAGMSAAKDNHPALEHFEKVARFVALDDAHLHRLASQLVVQPHGLKRRGGLLVLAALIALSDFRF